MDKDTKYYAIDISKDVFDVTDSEGHYYQFLNTHKGFNKFVKLLNETESLCNGGNRLLSLSVSLFFARKCYCGFGRKPIISKTIYTDETIKNQDRQE